MSQGAKQLFLQTTSLVAGFMVWVLISLLMPYIQADIKLSSTQISLTTAVPVSLGLYLELQLVIGQIGLVLEPYLQLVLLFYCSLLGFLVSQTLIYVNFRRINARYWRCYFFYCCYLSA